jgi:hypothetical protein
MKEHAINTSFMELVHIVVWNFHLLECIVRIDAFTVGDQWSSMIQ